MTQSDPIMRPRPLGFFSEWCVEVVWPNGYKQTVHGFRDEAHARGWMAQESKAWVIQARGPTG
jgi:hypothetical protein